MRSPPFEPETYYHLYNHAVGSDDLFREADNYRFFMEKYAHHTVPVVETYAYCLMPNHFHLLVRVRSEAALQVFFEANGPPESRQAPEAPSGLSKRIGQQLGNWLNAYTSAFNRRYHRRGRLFVENLKRKAITREAYLYRVVQYIHTNPVHHGFAVRPDDWPYSSYRTMTTKPPAYLEAEQVLTWFGGPSEYYQAHQEAIDPRLVTLMEY